MKPEDIARSYDAIADRWASDDFPADEGIAQHERAIAFAGGRGAALDVGCGASGRIVQLLLDHGFEPEGLDVSPRMVELARRRHPRVTFHLADVCAWEPPRSYDFVSAWDSIWHVPLDRQDRVLTQLLESLSPGGVLIFTTGGVDRPSERRDAAMGPPMYHAAPGIPRVLELVDASGCVCRHLEYDRHPESHVYVIAQKVSPGA